MTQIQIDWARTQETNRHNVATEVQAANELGETKRHNVAYEKETKRHNVATEKETKRHNKAGEKETNRHNVKTESIDKSRIKETVRHNKASESVERGKLKESIRHAKKTEQQQAKHLENERRQTEANVQKARAEAELTNAKTDFQKFSNSIDKSDPRLFKTNRFVNVFKSNAPAAWAYYGLDLASKKQQETLNAAAQYGNNTNKAVEIIDSLNYQKTGHHLKKEDKNAWVRIFSLGKRGSFDHQGKGGKFKLEFGV